MTRTIFVTGTDTDVGKTLVSAILVNAWKAKYWKPVQSGVSEGTDSAFIKRVVGEDTLVIPENYLLQAPLSPHTAADMEGVEIDLDTISLPERAAQPLVIEGAGGVLVPLNSDELMIDLMLKLQAEVLVVARSGLGTINHTLLTLEALRSRGLKILGVVLNGVKNPLNKKAIETYGRSKVVGEVEPLSSFSKEVLDSVFHSMFDLREVVCL